MKAAALPLALLVALPAFAGDKVAITVQVVHASKNGTTVDPALEKLKKRMADFGFTSYKLLDTKVLDLAVGEEGSVPLPGERRFIVKPEAFEAAGKLRVHAHVAGEARVTYTIEPGKDLVVGGVPHQDGKLVLVVSHARR